MGINNLPDPRTDGQPSRRRSDAAHDAGAYQRSSAGYRPSRGATATQSHAAYGQGKARTTTGTTRSSQAGQRRSAAYGEAASRSRYASSYDGRGGYGGRRRHSGGRRPSGPSFPVKIVCIVAVVLLLGTVAVFAFRSCTAPATTGNTNAASAAQTADTTAQKPAVSDVKSQNKASDHLVITLAGSQDTYVLKGESYIESGCHATDQYHGSVTDTVKISGSVDANKVGDYTITYTATDKDGGTASATRTVHVVDNMDADTDGIPVLMYHYIYSGEAPEHNSNYLEDVKFEEQLQWLTSEGYYYPSYQELAAYLAGTHSLPAKSVILTFDDGEAGFLEYGIPLLEKYRVPATSFLICCDEDAELKTLEHASPYCLFESHTYGCHTAGYSGRGKGGRIYDLSVDELVEDIRTCASILGTVEAVAYPFGDYCEEAQEGLRQAGVLCAFTVEYGLVHPGDDPTALQRIRVFADSSLDSYIYQVESGV